MLCVHKYHFYHFLDPAKDTNPLQELFTQTLVFLTGKAMQQLFVSFLSPSPRPFLFPSLYGCALWQTDSRSGFLLGNKNKGYRLVRNTKSGNPFELIFAGLLGETLKRWRLQKSTSELCSIWSYVWIVRARTTWGIMQRWKRLLSFLLLPCLSINTPALSSYKHVYTSSHNLLTLFQSPSSLVPPFPVTPL